MLEQCDLLIRLERACAHHHGLGIRCLDPLAVQGVERLHVGQVDAQRFAGEVALLELSMNAGRQHVRDACLSRHRPAHRRDACLPARLRQPWRVQPMVLRRRAEVPEHRVTFSRQDHTPCALVAGPLADVRARDVANVVLVEEKQCAELGVPQRLPRFLQPLRPELGEVDPLLPVDSHRRSARGDVHRLIPRSSPPSRRSRPVLHRQTSATRCRRDRPMIQRFFPASSRRSRL